MILNRASFEIIGRPHIDKEGTFKMCALPGMARIPQAPKAEHPRLAEARRLREEGMELADIAQKIGVTTRTVERWSSKGKLTPEIEL